MKTHAALATFAICLAAGCTSVKQGYDLSSKSEWSRYGSSCAGPLDFWERRIGDGVTMELAPSRVSDGAGIRVGLVLERGRTVQFVDGAIWVTALGGSEQRVPISEFVSGFRNPRDEQKPLVEFKRFPTTERLIGAGRFDSVPAGLAPRKGDRFSAVVRIADHYPLEQFTVRLPQVVVNGAAVQIPDAHFKYGEIRFTQCIQ